MSSTEETKWTPYAETYDPIRVGSIDGRATVPHDFAIVRACSTSYRPNKTLSNNPKATVFVGRLDKDVDEKDLEKLFSKHGTLNSVTVVRDIVTGFSKRYGFVEFKHQEDCRKARRREHKTYLKGRQILVDYEVQHTLPGWIPRRLGGGFGGYKESGQLRFGCLDRPWKKSVAPHQQKQKEARRDSQTFSRLPQGVEDETQRPWSSAKTLRGESNDGRPMRRPSPTKDRLGDVKKRKRLADHQ